MVKSSHGVRTQSSVARIGPGKHQRAEHGFGTTGLGALARSDILAVEGARLVPQANATAHIIHELPLGSGRRRLGELHAQRRARERVRHSRVTGEAERAVIAGGTLPGAPPLHSAIEVGGRTLRIPTAVRGYLAAVRARDRGERDAAERGGANELREPSGPHGRSDDRSLMHVDVPSSGASLPIPVPVRLGYPFGDGLAAPAAHPASLAV